MSVFFWVLSIVFLALGAANTLLLVISFFMKWNFLEIIEGKAVNNRDRLAAAKLSVILFALSGCFWFIATGGSS